MNKFKEDKRLLRGAFPKSSLDADPKELSMEASSLENQHYAISEHDVVKRFRIITRQRKIHSISYSMLPIITLTGGTELTISFHETTFIITGRNLEVLEEAFSLEQVIWVAESSSLMDDGSAHVFVENIQIIEN